MQIISSTCLLIILIMKQNLKSPQIRRRKFRSESKFQDIGPSSDAVIYNRNTYCGMNKNVSNSCLIFKMMH